MSNYKRISNIGGDAANAPANNPLTYCLSQTMGSSFTHGAIAQTVSSSASKNCQAFMSSYCANNWDEACEHASNNRESTFPNTLNYSSTTNEVVTQKLTSGEILIQNTATRKYLSKMNGTNCTIKYEPFDPTVASSPLIAFWSVRDNEDGCVPVYEVNPKEIDNDPVMIKILNKPLIAWSLLINIYNTSKRKGTLDGLKGTRLYRFFMSNTFQKYIEQMNVHRNMHKYI
jgi:hypothetical protein